MPRLLVTAAGAGVEGFQIQRPIHKLAITVAGAKSSGTNANDAFLSALQNISFQLRRVGGVLGEKNIWPRVTGEELISIGLSDYGKAYTTGALAATNYTGKFTIAINRDASHTLENGAYIELNINNGMSGHVITVDGIGHQNADYNLLRIERTAYNATENKTMNINGGDMMGASRLFLPVGIDSARIMSSAPYTADQHDVEGQLLDNAASLFNNRDGGCALPRWGAFSIDDDCRAAEVTMGDEASSVLLVREMFYTAG